MTTSEPIFRVDRLRQRADRSEEQSTSFGVLRKRVPREKQRHHEQTCSPESNFDADLGHQPCDEDLGDGTKEAAPDAARPYACKWGAGPEQPLWCHRPGLNRMADGRGRHQSWTLGY